MAHHTSIIGYFFQAGLVVKSVMLILLFASIASWTLIIQRAWFFSRIRTGYQRFYKRFWECRDLNQLYKDLDNPNENNNGLAAIFYSGFKEFLRINRFGDKSLEAVQRVMQIRQVKETERLEQHLPIFASIGSIAPFIGLFGTVWGIMTSFQALGQAQQATIAMVAPGISEALIATALGLFTAIPAVIAYNRYTTEANKYLNRYELFQEEFIALVEQQTSHSASV